MTTRFKGWLKWRCHYSFNKSKREPSVIGFSVGEYWPMGIFSASVSSSYAFILFLCNFSDYYFHFRIHPLCVVFSINNLKRRGNDDNENCLFCHRLVLSLILSCHKSSVFPSGIPLRVREKERESWFSSTSYERSHYKTSEFLRLRAMPQRVFTGDSCSRSARTVYKVPSNPPERKPSDRSVNHIHGVARIDGWYSRLNTCPCNFHNEIQIE